LERSNITEANFACQFLSSEKIAYVKRFFKKHQF